VLLSLGGYDNFCGLDTAFYPTCIFFHSEISGFDLSIVGNKIKCVCGMCVHMQYALSTCLFNCKNGSFVAQKRISFLEYVSNY